MTSQKIIDSTDRLDLEVDSRMRIQRAVIEASQNVPDSFLKKLSDQRDFQDAKFAPDDLQVASLPGAVVDHWYRNGFNIWDPNITARDIVTRLQKEGLTAFLTTTKTV